MQGLYDLAQEKGKTDSEAWCALKMVESFMLCNTVIVEQPEEDEGGEVHYQAESPDEGALVEGGKMCGYTLSARTQKELVGSVGPPHSQQRPRNMKFWPPMNSIMIGSACLLCCAIYRRRKLIFFCKGADSSMLERADPASIERSRRLHEND